jgi:hypothetical protein
MKKSPFGPRKNGPVLQQCTRRVPPRTYFAQLYFLAHGTCMGVSGGIVLLCCCRTAGGLGAWRINKIPWICVFFLRNEF